MNTEPDFHNLEEKLIYQALRIRLVEERIISLYPADKIQSPVHMSIGQEAVAVGVCNALRPTDLLFCTYRSHAFYLAKGGCIKEMFAELYGKSTGPSKGKAGSMHLAYPDAGLMGCSAIVASTIPHAVGSAMAAKRLKKDHLNIAVFGDGATEEGVYHESINFASLHQLPVVFVCENNGFAVHARLNERQSYTIAEHAKIYGLPVTVIEKTADPIEIQRQFAPVIEKARKDRLPAFVEIFTYRYKEHVGVNDDLHCGYRSENELKEWLAIDPLVQENQLVEKFTPAITAEIDEAVEFAEKSPWPTADDLLTDVF